MSIIELIAIRVLAFVILPLLLLSQLNHSDDLRQLRKDMEKVKDDLDKLRREI